MLLLTKLFSFIGVRGLIIIILGGIIAAETAVINVLRDKLNTQKEENAKVATEFTIYRKSCEGEISAINLQLKAADDKNKRLAEGLVVVKKANDNLDTVANMYKEQIMKRPLATTCDAAMTELKSQSAIIAEKWNKK